jgi:small multidrug resistance family-3 protein
MPTGTLRLALGLIILVAAAVFEVAGDAIIRQGMRARSITMALGGFLVLGSYGVTVNLLNMDFSRTLGTYVGVFAVTSVVFGKVVFRDRVDGSCWLGLAVILTGCFIIQYGSLPK